MNNPDPPDKVPPENTRVSGMECGLHSLRAAARKWLPPLLILLVAVVWVVFLPSGDAPEKPDDTQARPAPPVHALDASGVAAAETLEERSPPVLVTPGEEALPPEPTDWLAQNMHAPDEQVVAVFLQYAGEPRNDPARRAEALQHALNFLPDDNHALLEPLASDPRTPPEMQEILLSDAHTRPLAAALSTAVHLMQSNSPPVAAEARELTAFLLMLDPDTDPAELAETAKARIEESEEDFQ